MIKTEKQYFSRDIIFESFKNNPRMPNSEPVQKLRQKSSWNCTESPLFASLTQTACQYNKQSIRRLLHQSQNP